MKQVPIDGAFRNFIYFWVNMSLSPVIWASFSFPL